MVGADWPNTKVANRPIMTMDLHLVRKIFLLGRQPGFGAIRTVQLLLLICWAASRALSCRTKPPYPGSLDNTIDLMFFSL